MPASSPPVCANHGPVEDATSSSQATNAQLGLPHRVTYTPLLEAFVSCHITRKPCSWLMGFVPLDGLSVNGNAPRIFSKTSKSGLPWVAVTFQALFALIAYMGIKSGPGKGQAPAINENAWK